MGIAPIGPPIPRGNSTKRGNMTAIMVNPTAFIFGIPKDLPTIPEGWTMIPKKDQFLQAMDEQGTVYVVRNDGWAWPGEQPLEDGPVLYNEEKKVRI